MAMSWAFWWVCLADILYDFARYLAAKTSVDDQALNQRVRQTLMAHWPQQQAVRILEVGMGIGTMWQRLQGWGVGPTAVYTGIDSNPDLVKVAKRRLKQASPSKMELVATDVFAFAAQEQGTRSWDVLMAHAFLDLIDVSTLLPALFALLAPGGLFYFTLNFDRGTILQPTIDATLDAEIIGWYHETMDGRPAGESRTGRHLFGHIAQAGGQILAAGSSDWVVFANKSGYPHDEAYFLHFIIHTIHQALLDHPQLNPKQFLTWIKQRHAQIEAGTLVYIAHQLDFVGMVPSTSSGRLR